MVTRRFHSGKQLYRQQGVAAVFRHLASIACQGLSKRFKLFSSKLDFYASAIRSLNDRQSTKINCKFNNIHKSKRAFIIGTGPSLTKQNLALLESEITIGVNSFWKHPINRSWNATYYCIVDPYYFSSTSEWQVELKNLYNATAKSHFFFPAYGRDAVIRGGLDVDRVSFLNFAGWVNDGIIYSPDLSKQLPATWNVVQTGLLIAIAMGCNPIYLLGCDHNWQPGNVEWSHFHGESAVAPVVAAFSSNLQMYREAYCVFESYRQIREFCREVNVTVLNATAGGCLDVFERVNYDSLFD